MDSAQGWVLIITTISGLIGSIYSAWKASQAKTAATVATDKIVAVDDKVVAVTDKVDVVHDLTNSRLSEIEGQLKAALAKLAASERAGVTAEHTRADLAREAAQTIRDDKKE